VSRFETLMAEARRGLGPWDSVPADRLAAVARQCGAAEIAAIVADLDRLSAAFAALPEWDGDSQDDISAVQSRHAQILGLVAAALLPAIAAGLSSPLTRTRMWVALGLEPHGRLAVPALEEGLAHEIDPQVRQTLSGVLGRLAGA